jgi:RNA polymerase sigma-70 factor (ECF subfamily)
MPARPPDDELGIVAGRLYDEHGASLYRYALMLLLDHAAAEDAVQQVFAAILAGGRRATRAPDAHYLRRAVRNQCFSMLRRTGVRADSNARPLLENMPGVEADPAARVALERALAELPPEQREVVHLHVFEGHTFQEIANGCDESINTIASRYRYALAKLREILR